MGIALGTGWGQESNTENRALKERLSHQCQVPAQTRRDWSEVHVARVTSFPALGVPRARPRDDTNSTSRSPRNRRGVERLNCKEGADPPVRAKGRPAPPTWIPAPRDSPGASRSSQAAADTSLLLLFLHPLGSEAGLGCHPEDLGARPGRHPGCQRSVGGGHPAPRTASPALF